MRDINGLVEDWKIPDAPSGQRLEGRYVVLEKLSPDQHGPDLHRANKADDGIWDWLPYGPFAKESSYSDWLHGVAGKPDPLFHAIKNKSTGAWGGVASYLRVSPDAGSIEVGHINFSPSLQRTVAATEAMFLMMKWAFDAGYRRYEWKCNAANLGSRRAAERLGFSFEGVFRQAAVIKGRNRDTAWFAMIDSEWPELQTAFEQWLEPDNFTGDGRQVVRLSDLTRPIRVASDPALQDLPS